MTASLADLMCHRQSTAQKCYRLIEREHSCVTASKTLTETLAGAQTMKQTAAGPAEQTSAARIQGLMVPEVEETGTGGSMMEETAVELGKQSLTTQIQGLAATTVTAVDNTSAHFVRNDLFSSEIDAGNISMDIVRTKIKESDMLMSKKVLYNHIRSEIRKT